MDNLLQKFLLFSDGLSENKRIKINKNNTNSKIQNLRSDKFYEGEFLEALKYANVELTQNDKRFIDVATIGLEWTNAVEGIIFDDYIYGGFQMRGFVENLYGNSLFWDPYNFKLSNPYDISFLQKFKAFHKSSHGDDGTFGCFYNEPGIYPRPIYFYDSGVVFPMNLTLEQYYEAMLEHKAVMLWQYYYLDSKVIVEKLKDANRKNWLGALRVDDENAKGVDVVLANMDKIIRQFPILFPDKDITFYKKKREDLQAEYELNK